MKDCYDIFLNKCDGRCQGASNCLIAKARWAGLSHLITRKTMRKYMKELEEFEKAWNEFIKELKNDTQFVKEVIKEAKLLFSERDVIDGKKTFL